MEEEIVDYLARQTLKPACEDPEKCQITFLVSTSASGLLFNLSTVGCKKIPTCCRITEIAISKKTQNFKMALLGSGVMFNLSVHRRH